MRVLLTNHFPLEGSGSGIYTSNVARELTLAGHVAATITPELEPPPARTYETRWIPFGTPDGVPFNFPCFTTHPRSSTTFYELDDAEIEAYRAAWSEAIDRAVREFRPDVIHGQHLWVATALAAETGVPVVATCHGTDLMGHARDARYHPFASRAVAGARRVIAISRAIRESILETLGGSIDASRVRTVGNGFDTAIFHSPDEDLASLRRDLGADAAGRLVVFAGKLAGFKGVDVLLDAASIYEAEDPEVSTWIVGDGELRAELEAKARSLGLSRVRFAGHQPQSRLARWFQAADVAVFPSRKEPFGLVAIEAMACGTPVVATNEGGLPDFVTPKVGTLVPVEDAAALARAIRSESRAKATKGPVAAAEAARHHSWRIRVGDTIRVYEEALGTD